MIDVLLTGVELCAWVALLVGIFQYKHLDKFHRWVFYYISAMAILNGMSHLAPYLFGWSSLYLIPLSGLVTLYIFQKIYLSFLLNLTKPIYRILPQVLSWLIGLYFLYRFNVKDTSQFHTPTVVSSYALIVALCLRYCWEMLTRSGALNRTLFTFNIIVLSYFFISAIFFMTSNFLVNEALYLVAPFWMVYGISTLLFYVYLTYFIWQHRRYDAPITG